MEPSVNRPIELHIDLTVDPAKAADMVRYFEDVYRPAARRFPGYVDLQLLRLTSVLAGTAPDGLTYRFSITFETEVLRQAWVGSDVHAEVWSALERHFTSNTYTILLFDVI